MKPNAIGITFLLVVLAAIFYFHGKRHVASVDTFPPVEQVAPPVIETPAVAAPAIKTPAPAPVVIETPVVHPKRHVHRKLKPRE